MNKRELAQKVIMNKGGIAKTADFVSEGIRNDEVAAFCKEGFIERIRHGFYQLPEDVIATDEQMIKIMIPQGIVCVESALFHYGYSDFLPQKWSIAVPRTASRMVKRIQQIPLKAYFVQKDFFNLGRITDDFNGIELAVYDRERTLCDCFKYRTKLDSELFNKAVNNYVIDDKKNLANLSKYAKEMHIYTRVMNIMEVLLSG